MQLYDISGFKLPEEDICHHGIKGQKWGVRRYQNPDGSLTDLGKKRYLRNGKLTEKGKKKLDAKKYAEHETLSKIRNTAYKNSQTLKTVVPDVTLSPVGNTVSAEVSRKVNGSTIKISSTSLGRDNFDFSTFSEVSDNPKKFHDAAVNGMKKLLSEKSEGVKQFRGYRNSEMSDYNVVKSLSEYITMSVNEQGSPVDIIVNGEPTYYHDWILELDPKTLKVVNDYFDT